MLLVGILISVALAMLVMLAVTAAEFVAPIDRYPLKARLPGLLYGSISMGLGLLTVRLLQEFWQMIGSGPLLSVPVQGVAGEALAIAFGIVLADLGAYWHHRFLHRFLWRVHAVHHSQTELMAANNYAHFTERASSFLVVGIPLSLIQFQVPATPYVLGAIIGALEFYIHSPTSAHFGPIGKVLVDNRFHRIHHSLEPHHFDKNFGILFSFWDRLFGTVWEPEPGEWPATGIAGVPPPKSVPDYLLMPLRRDGLVRVQRREVVTSVGSKPLVR